MSRETQIEFIRGKAIEANPALEDRSIHCFNCECMDDRNAPEEIRLADVLLAIGPFTTRNRNQSLNAGATSIVEKWNLRVDNLIEQSPETIDFIYNLLV